MLRNRREFTIIFLSLYNYLFFAADYINVVDVIAFCLYHMNKMPSNLIISHLNTIETIGSIEPV